METLRFVVGLCDQFVGPAYALACMYIFGALTYTAVNSAIELKGAIVITANAIAVHMFSKYRAYDLLKTVPKTFSALAGSIAVLCLVIFQPEVPIHLQAVFAFLTFSFIMYYHYFLEVLRIIEGTD